MKLSHGWYFPDHELHLPAWFATAKKPVALHGRIAYQGNKQVEALKHVKQFRVAIDVGAHVGLWSYNLAHEFAEVIAFEPMAAHRECLEANMFGARQHIQVLPIALGAVSGTATLASERGSSGNTRVIAWGAPIADDAPEFETVIQRRLDDFEFPVVDFIKIDCEGYEEQVVIGAVETLERCKPTIIVEQKHDFATRYGNAPGGAVKVLESLGYHVVWEYSGDFVMVPR